MPVYEYSAITSSGKKVRGTIEADNFRVAQQKLKSKGIYPTDIKESKYRKEERTRDIKKFFTVQRVSLKDVAIATRQLSTLLNSGMPLVESLQALSEQLESVALKKIIVDVKEQVQEGASFAKALRTYPKVFSTLYVNMVSAGEASGSLDSVMGKLADYLERQVELRRKVFSSLLYPVIILIFCILIVIGLLTFVVPSVTEIFVKRGVPLPLPTRILLAISGFINSYWYILLVLLLGSVFFVKKYYATEKGRRVIDRILLKIPVLGSLLLRIDTARFASTMGTLLSSGVGLLDAMTIGRNIVSNVHLKDIIDNAREGVREGRSLSRELKRGGLFPAMLIHMIGIGEASGSLEDMMLKAAKAYESEVNTTIAGLTTLIEPVMLISLGVIVFSIVISVLLPMVDLMNIVK